MDPHGNGQEHKRWPLDLSAKLRELWPINSASRIGELLGKTRNAVISKANRLHLANKKQAPAPRKERRFAAIPKPPPAPPVPAVVMQPPVSRNRTVLNVRDGECRYPLGDYPPFLFCGAVVQWGSPYCAFHHRLCNHPVTPTRRDMALDPLHWRGVR